MILAIDTSIGTSVAVVSDDGDTLSEASTDNTRGHAEAIGRLIRQAMSDAGAAPSDIALVAAGMGPGPFTGLRIGIAAARAFAVGRGVEVVPVVSHDGAGAGTVITDARRREVAVSTYDGVDADGLPRRTSGPELRPSTGDEQLTTRISAAAIGRIAAIRHTRGIAPDATEPLYLRSPDVMEPRT
ncbi:MAG: tRNA (adenosine(37)-N6)-threonylcarbamoyltransferase complex dimerization subunit type 1 TsaB [Microbacterium sp.]